MLQRPLHATVQFTCDAFLVSLMAYATGGVQSVFAPLYFGLIFGSAIHAARSTRTSSPSS